MSAGNGHTHACRTLESRSAAAVNGGHGDRIHIKELPDSPLLVLLQRPRCTSRPLIGSGDWFVDRQKAADEAEDVDGQTRL